MKAQATIVRFLQATIDLGVARMGAGLEAQVAILRERYRKSSKSTKKKKAILDERRCEGQLQGSDSSREALKFEKIDDAKPSRGLSRSARLASKTEGK